MKKETKKNLISLTCALAFVAVGGGVALTQNHAKAEEIKPIPENQMVLEEPEFRLKKAEEDENRNGLRFVVKAPNATELPEGTTETGTLVIPTDLLSGDLTVNTKDVHKFVTTEAWNIYEDDGAYTYAYFWNMSESSYNVEMTYRAYIVMGGTTYYTETATTSLAEVALDFINNSTDDGEKAVADQFLLKYDVTFVVGDSSTTVNAQQVKYGSKLTEVVTPELEGHTFNGWLLNGEAFDVKNTAIKGDIELVADWKVNTYAVTFKDVDGDTTRFETLEVDWNKTATAPEFIALEPYKADALVWNTEDGETFNFDTPITENTTLVAKRVVDNVIDFTTMTRLPSELMKSKNGFGWATDDTLEGKRVLKVNALYSGDSGFIFTFNEEDMIGAQIKVTFSTVSRATNNGVQLFLNNKVSAANLNWWSDGTNDANLGQYVTFTMHHTGDEALKGENLSLILNSGHGNGGHVLYIQRIEWYAPEDLSNFDFHNINFSELGENIPVGLVANFGCNTQSATGYQSYSYNTTEQALQGQGTQENKKIDGDTTLSPINSNLYFTNRFYGLSILYDQMPAEERVLPEGTKIVVNMSCSSGTNIAINGWYGAWYSTSGYKDVTITLKKEVTLESISIHPGANSRTDFYVKSVTIELPQA